MRGLRSDRLWRWILGAWAIGSALLMALRWPQIVRLEFIDRDDAMRLLEVRDWLAGQSWWDVSQHRLWGGHFDMHWSRLVDLPVAAVIAPLDAVAGPTFATRAALVIVPLTTLLVVLVAVTALSRRLLTEEEARFAPVFALVASPVVQQLQPMRIDHHGWQIFFAVVALTALLSRPGWKSGIAMGAALAMLIVISLEGLPIAAALMGIAALAWVLRPERAPQMLGAGWMLLAGTIVLHAVTRGPAMFEQACDAVSPVWIVALAIGVATLTGAPFFRLKPVAVRLSLLGGGALAAGCSIALIKPDCLHGPFASLDPLVYRLWYLNILEGLPLWDQRIQDILKFATLPIAAMAGAAIMFSRSSPQTRILCGMYGMSLFVAFAASVAVVRAAGTANAFAIPAAIYLVVRLFSLARSLVSVPARIVATVAALACVAPGPVLAGGLAAMPFRDEAADDGAIQPTDRCLDAASLRRLKTLPEGVIFSQFDIAPDLLAKSHRRAVGAGYHRNDAALHSVLAAFTLPPDRARYIVLRSRAAFVAGCPGEFEGELYREVAPDGLWARLNRGERIGWLEPVPMGGGKLRVWRVVPADMRTPPSE
ncbi:hypothetical protein [Stakelama saccharophila]|uniref:Uncharacterized protein n=1 Tax=Stakelama saccharophila TaxID=3075605 RepID=A0ABZ0BAF2_9SPHN|nr:hypothetical protein [Stakelama sp. W311]WNO54182.1 hypothetical protein RPR59_02665 [Stakelama sp. W311]